MQIKAHNSIYFKYYNSQNMFITNLKKYTTYCIRIRRVSVTNNT